MKPDGRIAAGPPRCAARDDRHDGVRASFGSVGFSVFALMATSSLQIPSSRHVAARIDFGGRRS
jgi:hypothetical protein